MLACGGRCLQRANRSKSSLRRALLSSNTKLSSNDVMEDLVPSQPFVKTRLEPGEWDPQHTNPLYRPKFRSSARIIASDDFANRPSVGLSEEFESLQDAMVTLSWLDQNDHKLVYQLYLDLMVSAESTSGGRTSHEYVMRVIAQKFNITADRVAAIVQLQHNEQQMLLENPDIQLCTELADEMDQAFKAEIDEAYQTFNLKKPESFVEDPAGTADLKPSSRWVIADDVFDVDQMSEDAILREDRDARLIIDGHVYIEDVDQESIPVPLDKDCRSLLKQRETIAKKMAEENAVVLKERAKKTALEPKWRTTNGEGETRERYKFIVQTVNTRQLKKARAKHRSYINNSVANTLVEHNGELRSGNMADMDSVSWKGIRNDHEHTYAGAKQGWLERMNRNATKSWGKAPPRIPRLQQPVPLPPKETTSDEVGSLDEILGEENASDQTVSNIVAANIEDIKEITSDTQAIEAQTPSSTDEEIVALNVEGTNEETTAIKATVDVAEVPVATVEEIDAAVSVDDHESKKPQSATVTASVAVAEVPVATLEEVDAAVPVDDHESNNQQSTTVTAAVDVAELPVATTEEVNTAVPANDHESNSAESTTAATSVDVSEVPVATVEEVNSAITANDKSDNDGKTPS